MSLLAYPTLLGKLRNKEYRRAFVSAGVRNSVALQIRALRKERFGTQAALGKALNTASNVVSRYENPDYGSLTVRTLLDLAKAFNVALRVRFVTFGEFASQIDDLSDEALIVPSFDEELKDCGISPAISSALEKAVMSTSREPIKERAFDHSKSGGPETEETIPDVRLSMPGVNSKKSALEALEA